MQARRIPLSPDPSIPSGSLPTPGAEDSAQARDTSPAAAVRARDALQRRALMAADAIAAVFALLLAISVFSNDRLSVLGLAIVPVAVLAAKLVGLYDRDELLLHKTTADEVPAIFQLATVATLVTWLLDDWFIDGMVSKEQVLSLWVLLTIGVVGMRFAVRRACERSTEPERCLLIGDTRAFRRLSAKFVDDRINAMIVASTPPQGRGTISPSCKISSGRWESIASSSCPTTRTLRESST